MSKMIMNRCCQRGVKDGRTGDPAELNAIKLDQLYFHLDGVIPYSGKIEPQKQEGLH